MAELYLLDPPLSAIFHEKNLWKFKKKNRGRKSLKKVVFSGCCGVLPSGILFPVASSIGCWMLTSKALSKNCSHPKFHPHPRDGAHPTPMWPCTGLVPSLPFRASLRSHPVPDLPTGQLKPQLNHSQILLQPILLLSAPHKCCSQGPPNLPNLLHANLHQSLSPGNSDITCTNI